MSHPSLCSGCPFVLLALGPLLGMFDASADGGDALRASPARIVLEGPESSQQLLITGDNGTDLTRRVRYECRDTTIAEINSSGKLVPRGDGVTSLTVQHQGHVIEVPIAVTHCDHPSPISFQREVMPILSKARCNSGGCHGKAEGQNGFRLSVFGFDAKSDYNALVRDGRGRRVTVFSPTSSLLLAKATAETPHGGGQKIVPGSLWYRRVARWISEGAKSDAATSRQLVEIEVEPASVIMSANTHQQLRVTAIDSDGRRRCVTAEADYESNASSIASVDRDGLVSVSETPGEAAILVRYMEQVTVCRVTLPQAMTPFPRPPEHNFVDTLAADKWQQLGLVPSGLCDDATFLRRVYLDTIGTLPTIEEVTSFLADSSTDKRERLIGQLLTREEYADYWTMKWADILRVDKSIVSPRGAVAMTRWIHGQIRNNTPYDQFAAAVVKARGDTLSESPASFFKVHQDAELAARAISQVFLGVRLECAQCHHHPADRWSQTDYYAFANLFSEVGHVKSKTGGEKIVRQSAKHLSHPGTGQAVPAATLGGQAISLEDSSNRRDHLVQWMASPENPYFARMIVNRLWAHYFGRGLVEPIDDLRATNPATNEPLLAALANHLRELDYDLKEFTKSLLESRTYQLDWRSHPSNQMDQQNYSHATWKAIPAEILLDAICQVTGVPEQFNGWPDGYRAIKVWDNRVPSYFLRIFGKPQRVTVCQCERGNEPSIAQALHLMNSDETSTKVSHRDGRAAMLARSQLGEGEIIQQLYLAALSRYPSSEETAWMRAAFTESTSRRSAIEDILWSLLNTREFIYNH